MSKKEIQEKELKTVLAKDIGAKNPILSPDHISELHAIFSLYADPRQRRADVRDILLTASTLGLDSKYEFVFRLIQEIHDSTGGNALDFESFLKELTARIVFFSIYREALFLKKEERLISPFLTLREKVSSISLT
jgi:Ca2+-binding EF-hand superfamily protein